MMWYEYVFGVLAILTCAFYAGAAAVILCAYFSTPKKSTDDEDDWYWNER